MTSVPGPVGGIVLTGGTAVRLDGADKSAVEVGGRSLLERALDALAGMATVVVGPEVPTSRPVTFRREEPPGGGPAAGVLAGLTGFGPRPALVVVLAVDMPLVTAGTVGRLLAAVRDRRACDGAVLVDSAGRQQHLCAVYAVSTLERRSAAVDRHGLAMRRLVDGLDLVAVPATGLEAQDVDTWADLARLRHDVGPDQDRRGLHGGRAGPRLDP